MAAATALGTVGDSEEPDTGLTLSQQKAGTHSFTLLRLPGPCRLISKVLQTSPLSTL